MPDSTVRIASSVDRGRGLRQHAKAFLQRWNEGRLPYEYQDGIFDPAAVRSMLAAADPVQAYCQDAVLWGELAGDVRLVELIRTALQRLHQWLGQAR